MAKVWNNTIDKNTDWGGDDSTGNLPVSGEKVQEFIKNTLDTKAGLFHYDTDNNRYLVFADSYTRDEYIEDTTKTHLIIGTFDAPFNYSAEISLSSPTYVAILTGTTNNYLTFTFDTKNRNGQSVGEDVICVYTFIRNGVKNVVTEKYRSGATVQFNIDAYLGTGTNSITIGITGQNTLAATTVGITYMVVDLTLTSTYDVSQMYNPANDPTASAAIPYYVSGYGTKTMEWYLDGVLLPYVKSEDEVVETSTSRVKYISLANLNQGHHSVQFRAYTIIDGEKFYSNTIYHDVLIYTGVDYNPIIGASAVIPTGQPLVVAGETLQLYGIEQYIPYEITFAVYNPRQASQIETVIAIDGTTDSIVMVANGSEEVYTLRPTYYGVKTLTITAGVTTYVIGLNITKSTTSLEPVTSGLMLDLSALGKTNSSADKDSWVSGTYSTTFTGFNWNTQSGWNNNRLVISNGAYISVNVAPLANDPASLGRTLEFEFSTKNVLSDDAVICDMRNANGTGLLITASNVLLKSASGVTVSAKFKSGDNIRVSLVINPRTGVTNKGLVFVYIDGILSGAAPYSTVDNFTSDTTLKIGGITTADMELKQLRFYTTALSSDQILNNYTLYRDSSEDLLTVYDRNNIYEEGTYNLNLDALAGQCPVLKITGDIPTLENTSDKNTTIYVDLEYVNLQDPTRSFTTKGTRMRPQGTSSMGYPKKNFRIYTNYGTMYDYSGVVISGGKYSFTGTAQPVDCFCFKADYAESSGTSNTGISRLWNQVMVDTQLSGSYVLRTEAQKSAVANNYNYDVRTTVDGFPCHLVYRLTESSDWIYIGKYNFNNDKSTESVFGFEGIPGFDNSKMKCFEVLNNGNALANFETMANFDSAWDEAYESRYPDGGTDVADLKDVSAWIVSTRHASDTSYSGNLNISAEIKTDLNGTYADNAANRQLKFEKEKWDYLDVYKIAAYYVYLMRFGAVDQVIKNSMFTTEGTQGVGTHCKWYYINYDNDTITGVRNDGRLVYSYDIDRQSLDTSFTETVYAYAGHSSTLWNNLESDAEFMKIVSDIDNALFTAGLTYAKTLEMFEDKQSAKWNERIYNQDAQYKYIGPYTDSNIDNLFMAQGSRKSHRRWWLSHRFNLLDSKFVSGAYKSKSVEFKVAAAPIGIQFSITAGSNLYYGYGINNVIIESGHYLTIGSSHTFTTKQVLNVGDPVRIYAAINLQAIDLSNFIEYLSTLSISEVFDEDMGTRLKKLILGVNTTSSTKRNNAMSTISGLGQATSLEYLDISGFTAINTLDLSSQGLLKTLKAYESGLSSLIIAPGSLTETLELPASMQSLSLNNLSELSTGLSIKENGKNLTSIEIKNCPKLDTKTFIFNWFNNKVTANSGCSVTLEGISWTSVTPESLISLGGIITSGGILSIRGTIVLTSADTEIINTLKGIFGENSFTPGNELYISAPEGVFITGPSNILEGSVTQYTPIVFSDVIEGTYVWRIVSGVTEVTTLGYDTIDNTGLLTSNESQTTTAVGTARTLVLRCRFTPNGSVNQIYSDFTVTIGARYYPYSSSTITGDKILSEVKNYGFIFNPVASNSAYVVNADYSLQWSLSGDAYSRGLVDLVSYNNEGCVVSCKSVEAELIPFVINVTIVKSWGHELLTINTPLDVGPEGIIMTSSSNAAVMAICYAQGWASNASYMTETEASAVYNIGTAFKGSAIVTFNEFKYFVNHSYILGSITNSADSPFQGCSKLTSITLPNVITTLGLNCFYSATNLTVINGLENVTSVYGFAFYNCPCPLDSLTKGNITYIGASAFYNAIGIKNIDFLSESLVTIPNGAFRGCIGITSLKIPDSVTTIESFAFYTNNKLTDLQMSGKMTLGTYVFSLCSALTSLDLGNMTDVSFGQGCFDNVPLVSLILPKGVCTFDSLCFYGNKLSEITLPEQTTNFYLNAFNTLTGNIRKVHFPKNCSIISYNSSAVSNSSLFFGHPIEEYSVEAGNTNIAVSPTSGAVYSLNTSGAYNVLLGVPRTKTGTIELDPCITIGNHIFSQTLYDTVIVAEGTTSLYAYALGHYGYASNYVNGWPHKLKKVVLPSTITSVGTFVLANVTTLETIESKIANVSSVTNTGFFGTDATSTTTQYSGYSRRADGTNMLYVPQISTGYTAGEWGNTLTNVDRCGFTINYTL